MSHLYATVTADIKLNADARFLSFVGHPASEFLMPLFVLAMLAIMPWQQVWQATSLLVIVVMVPAALFLTARSARQDGGGVDAMPTGRDGHHWTRGQVCVTSASGCFQALSLPLAFHQQVFSFTRSTLWKPKALRCHNG